MAYVLWNGKKLPKWIFDQRSPATARRVYFKRSLKAAAHAFCKECVGSPVEARKCECTDCPLWPFRPGVKRGDRPSCAPTEDDLLLIEEQLDAAKKVGKDETSLYQMWRPEFAPKPKKKSRDRPSFEDIPEEEEPTSPV